MQKKICAAMSVGQVDIDMKCAHPTFVADILGNVCPAPIIEYIHYREAVLKKCMQATGLSCKVVKPLYNVPFFADEHRLGSEHIGYGAVCTGHSQAVTHVVHACMYCMYCPTKFRVSARKFSGLYDSGYRISQFSAYMYKF